MRFVLAVCAAVLVQIPVVIVTVLLPTIFAGATIDEASAAFLFYLFFVLAYALGAVVLIGIPVHFWLRGKGLAKPKNLAIAGIASAVSIEVLFFFPIDWSGGFSFGAHFLGEYRELIIDGMPTIWGWLSFLWDAALFSIHGAVGAVVYGVTWERVNAHRRLEIKRTT